MHVRYIYMSYMKRSYEGVYKTNVDIDKGRVRRWYIHSVL